MEHYSRSSKQGSKKPRNRKPASHHVKSGLSAFQKMVATISSILSIIIAFFTIMALVNKDKTPSTPKPNSSTNTTTIIHEVDKNRDTTNSQPIASSSSNVENSSSSSQESSLSSSSLEETTSTSLQTTTNTETSPTTSSTKE